MEELIQRFRHQLGRKEYDALDETWLELLGHDTPLSEMLGLVDLVGRWGPDGKSALLLGLLGDDLRDKGRHQDQLTVLRRLAQASPDDPALARETAACLQRLHAGTELLDRILQKVGLGYGTRLDRALENFDLHVALVPGRQVFDPDAGPGSVTKMDLLLDRVTIAGKTGAETTLDIVAAGRQLRVSPPDGFFTLLAGRREELARLCREEPGRAVALFLRDTRQRASVSDIKAAFAEVVPTADWAGFWDRARRAMTENPHVAVLTSPGRTYRWQDEPAAAGPEQAVEGSKVRRAVPAEEKLGRVAPDVIGREYEALGTTTARKQLLERIRAARPGDWDRVYAAVFRLGRDNRSRQAIEAALSRERPELWQAVVEASLTGYRQSPEAFVWLLENAERLAVAGPRGLLSRMLDLLESINYRPHWTNLRKRLADGGYRVVLATLDEAGTDEARRLFERVHRCRGLEEFRKQEVADIFTARFPDLLEPDVEIIWGTTAGIEKARAELRTLMNKELPAVADEIARARSHGDLSENYEYKAGKEKQARLMARINRMRDELSRSRDLDPHQVDTSAVSPGCRVVLAAADGAGLTYTILGPWESDPDRGVISHQSPLAQ
ncbi:hypothetical protein FJY71_06895, partial [candidate division WOR-3 bacterium]|nr:hypothetical protein [candidate division WOR-3 bacterium]